MKTKKERILVAGGAGFIGSHVCEALIGRGNEVVCIDNFNDYYTPQIKENNLNSIKENPNFKIHKGDIRDLDFIRKVFVENHFDKVIHLAARAGVRPSIENPLEYEEVNIKGALNLLELSKNHRIKNFIFASSSSVYGERRDVPFSEEDRVDNPVSPYAATKKSGELLCHTYAYLHNLPITCLRFFTVYGPRGRPDMAPYKFLDLIEKGEPLDLYIDERGFYQGKMARDFTYVDDIVQGILLSLDKPQDYEIINLGRGSPVKINEFVNTLEGELGKNARKNFIGRVQGDVSITYANIEKAKNMLGYSPKTDLSDGVKKLAEWYKSSKKKQ